MNTTTSTSLACRTATRALLRQPSSVRCAFYICLSEASPSAADVAAYDYADFGERLLGFTASGRAISFAPPEAAQKLLAAAKFERLAPGGPVGAIVRTEGTYELVEGREAKLRLEVDSASLGPLPLPTLGRSTEEQLELLDPLMCVTRPGGGGNTFSVWVRPSMASAQAKDAMDAA